MAKKITLKNKAGEVLCPHTAIEQVQGLKEALDDKLGKTEKAASATKADSATKASKLITTTMSGIDVNNRSNSEGVIEYHSMLPNTTANIPTAMGYQNAVMSFGLLNNGATAQMFFAKDKPLYYRSSHTGDWKQLRTIDDKVTTSHIADTAITSSKLASNIILKGTPQLETQPSLSSESQNIASVGLVKKAVDGIEIGGVNLILNSDFSSGTEHWSKLNRGSLSAIEGVATFTLEAVANGQGMTLTSPVDIVSGQQYTVSFDVRSEDVQTLNYCFLIGVGVGNVSLSGLLSEDVITPEWQRIKRTFTASVSGTYKFGFGIQKLTGAEGVIEFQFKKLKIEKGNKATDWSPAPEDIVNGIKIDTRNLIPDSESIYTKVHATSNSFSKQILLPIGTKVGDTFVFNCDGIVNNQGSATEYSLLLFDWASQRAASNYLTLTAENRMGTFTITRDVAVGSLYIFLYAGKNNSTAGNAVTYTNCTLVKGNKPMLLWQPSVEEVQGKIDAKLPLSGGTLTGDITAPSFKTNLTSGVAEAVMAYPVNISWGNDLNGETYLKAGMYRTSSATSTVNQPNEKGHSNLLTIRGNESDNIAQMFFDYWNNGKVFTRVGSITVDTTSTSHIFNRDWKQLRTIDDKVTTSHIADTAITPAKIQTSIALNGTPSMTVEPTTSSPDKTIASVGLVKEAVADLEIDTRNLIPNSTKIGRVSSSSDNYSFVTITLPTDVGVKIGDVFTFNCDKVENVQGNPTKYSIRLYNKKNGTVASKEQQITAENRVLPLEAWIDVEQGELALLVYMGEAGSTAGNEVYFYDCTLVKGNKPMLLWQAAPEDIQAQIDNIEIGGTNLLRYIKDDGSSYWESRGTCDVTITDDEVIRCNANGSSYPRIMNASVKDVNWEPNAQYVLSYYARGEGEYARRVGIVDINATNGVLPLHTDGVYTSEWKKYVYSFTTLSVLPNTDALLLQIYCANIEKGDTTSWLEIKDIKIERGNKATAWSPAPEDVQANISNAETRSKAFAEDYTNAEIDKIENGQTVAQKANSLYDDDSGTYKNWGEIDTAITRKIGDKFEDYATKSYVQGEISKQVAVPIASETEDGKVKLATPEDVTAVENDNSAVNDSAKAVTPYTLKEYIVSKNFATDSDISSAVTAAKPTIFFQAAQPAGGKDGDIWIIP